MFVTKFSYGLTIAQENGSYSKAHLEADIHPGDDFSKVQAELVSEVQKAVGLVGKSVTPVSTPVTAQTATTKTANAPAQSVDRRAARPAPTPAKAAPAKAATPAAKAAPAKAAKAAAKETPYDRENPAHKKLVKELLNELVPGWQKNAELNTTAGTVSQSLVGKPFLGVDGAILESFKDEVAVGFGLGEPAEETDDAVEDDGNI